jgi:hypothetical protein
MVPKIMGSECREMTPQIKPFVTSQSGAVNVDWVVLTAAIFGMGMAALVVVSNGTEEIASRVQTALQNTTPARTPFAGNGASVVGHD